MTDHRVDQSGEVGRPGRERHPEVAVPGAGHTRVDQREGNAEPLREPPVGRGLVADKEDR